MKAETKAKKVNISAFLKELLLSRGICDSSAAESFLSPSLSDLTPFVEIPHLVDAANRICEVAKSGNYIVIYGDYDCDGICATAILLGYLRDIGASVGYFIPHRTEDGYGLSAGTVEKVLAMRPDLVVTVDCGISSAAEIASLSAAGVEVIVTDHHILPSELPKCLFVNAKTSYNSATHDICGAGLALRLVQAMGGNAAFEKYLDVAAIATIGDMVPLLNDNRILAAEGLKRINGRERRMGLELILQKSKLGSKKIDSRDVAFSIVPKINSAGRMDTANGLPELFLSNDYFALDVLTDKLNTMNKSRQELCDQIYMSAVAKLRGYQLYNKRMIVLSDPNWSPSVIGIAAARLVKEFSRPVLLFCEIGDGTLKGSGRSVPDVDLYALLNDFRQDYISFGGHKSACGITVYADKIAELEIEWNGKLNDEYSVEPFLPQFTYDAVWKKEYGYNELDDICKLEPFGVDNPAPVFKLDGVFPVRRMGNGTHLKGRLGIVEVISFGNGIDSGVLSNCPDRDCFANVEYNEFNGRGTIQARLTGYKLNKTDRSMQSYFTAEYLKQLLTKKSEVTSDIVYLKSFSDAVALSGRSYFGTLYISYDVKNAEKLKKEYEKAGKSDFLRYTECYKKSVLNPYNELVMAPIKGFDYSMYRNIVFLEKPATESFVNAVCAETDANVYVLENEFKHDLIGIDADIAANVYDRLLYSADSGRTYADIFDLYEQNIGTGIDFCSFAATFLLFFANGIVKLDRDFCVKLKKYRYEDLKTGVLTDHVVLL